MLWYSGDDALLKDGQRPMKCKALFFTFALSLSPAMERALMSDAEAQDACTVQEVDDALNQLSCFADGAYLSPQGIADSVSEICYDEYSEDACRACFRSARRKLYPSLKGLGRIGLISRQFAYDLKDALDYAEDDTCYLADDWPWDSGSSNNNGDNMSRNKQNGRGASGNRGARGRATATNSRPSIKGKGADARQLVEDLCPCNSPRWQGAGGQEAFLACTDTVTDILARHGKIDSRRARDLRSQLQRSECGR